MIWSEEQKKLIKKYKGLNYHLDRIPEEDRRYKCWGCFKIVKAIENKWCQCCGCRDALEIACPLDHDRCVHEIFSHSEMCPVCNQPICPECGSHDVTVISRVTGYLQDLAGWNMGKRQEFLDRKRYEI